MTKAASLKTEISIVGVEALDIHAIATALCQASDVLERTMDVPPNVVAAALAEALARQLERLSDDGARCEVVSSMCAAIVQRVVEIRRRRLAAMLESAGGLAH